VTISSFEAESGNRFELLVQSITDYAIYMLDPTGMIVSWNAGAQRFKGYTASEIIGEHFSRFYTDQGRAAGLPAIALATAEREGRFEAEGWRVRKDGSRFWANVVIDPVRTPDGTLVGFVKITRDLTERRVAEEELRRSEERFRLLVQSVTDYAIYMLDPTGVIVSWNPGAQRFKGYTEAEIIGRHFSTFYTDEDRAIDFPATALATAEREGRFEAEGWRVRKDGSRFWASVVIDAVRDPGGKLIGFAKVTRDLTERREAQQALERTQEAFFQSQKLDAIGKLTGGVAHDFNNLLAVVIGSLDLARRRLEEGGDITRFIDNARTAAERGATLTQRMLAFARRQDLTLQSVDLATLVESMADLMDRTLGAGVTIETDVPMHLPPVHADPGQLELALLNLTVNARDAMPDGGTIAITGRTEMLAEDNPLGLPPATYVRLAVTDEGHGMDDATLARAIEPFFTTKGVGKGTGLGLSMVQGLAEQSGGRLSLSSAASGGTTAELWLPIADEKAAPAATRTVSPNLRAATHDSFRVLVVDDDPLVQTNTAAMLEDLGHHIIATETGRDALDQLRREKIDLLITDYAMPQMNGAQLIEAARAIRCDLPALIVSGYAELPPDSLPSIPRIAKPFSTDQLIDGIERAITDAQKPKVAHSTP
jgi:PAS domain S-box-containing protein